MIIIDYRSIARDEVYSNIHHIKVHVCFKRQGSAASSDTSYVLLTNRIPGPYCKLQTAFFPLQFMAQMQSTRAMNWRGSALTYSTDLKNEVSKIFITSLGKWVELESTPQSRVVRMLEHGSLNQAFTVQLVPQRYNKYHNQSWLSLAIDIHIVAVPCNSC